jgi:hypothetical protein
MRAPEEVKTIATGFPLNAGLNPFSKFPIGEMWKTLRLTFHHAVTIGNGAGAVPLGEYAIIRAVNLKTDLNEVICDNVPGRAFHPLGFRQHRVAPYNIPVAAASATYDATVDIPFGLSWLKRPEDFYINSKRHKSVELTMTMGSVADLFTAPGTASVILTVDISLVRTVANLWAPNDRALQLSLPHKIPYFKHMAALDPSATPYWDIESADDFWITDFILSMGVSAVAGVPYSGTPADGLNGISFEDNVHTYLAAAPLGFFKQERRMFLGVDLVGAYMHSFIPNGSYREAYRTKQKSDLKLRWDSAAGAAPLQADLLLIGYRNPKPKT